jgi:RNA polymerase sigma-70 factor (ECF subfamily)
MLNLYRALRRYDPGRPLKPWLFTIARNASISAIRARGVLASQLSSVDPDDTPDPVSCLTQREKVRELTDNLQRLSPRRRKALVLSSFVGLPYAEIGRHLGTSEVAARQCAFQARNEVRRLTAAI